MKYALWIALAAGRLLAQDIVISQVYGGGGNTGAPLRQDFVELFNRGRATVNVTGWSVQYASATGENWQVTTLNGSIAPGRYFLVQQAEGANTSLPALSSPDAQGTIAMSATAGKVALARSASALSGTRPADAVDLVGYGTANGFRGSGPAAALTNSTALARRGAGCTDTGNNSADFQVATPRPRNSATDMVDCSATAEPGLPLRISEIQGDGAQSPYQGRTVTTRGVVTGRKRDGFWIQSLPGEEDDRPETSEALWVYFAMSPPGTTDRGYVVQVSGVVQEFRPPSDPDSAPLTEIVDPRYEVVARGQTLPRPVALEPGADWERYESMLVELDGATAVSPTVGGAFYATLPGQPRPYRGPAVDDEPERFRLDTRAQSAPTVNTTSPNAVAGVAGPLDYAFRTWTVAQEPGAGLSAGDVRRAQPLPRPAESEFVAVSMNLQRFGPDSPALKRTKIAGLIRDYLHSPDIVAVQEADNIDVLRQLARDAGDYDAHLIEGNDIGGIDVGFLTRRDRVRVDSVVQEGQNVTTVGGALFERPPLVAKLSVAGVPLTVINVHLRSLVNAADTVVEARRRAQAEFVRDLAAARIRAGETVLVLGDFNTLTFDANLGVILAGGLANLTETLPPAEHYSYIQTGATQTLDHILVSESLRGRFVRLQYGRFNADFPESAATEEQSAERVSDHDFPAAYFTLNPSAVEVSAAGVTNAATFLSGPVSPSEIVTVFGRGFAASSRVFFDNVAATGIYADANQISVVVPPTVAGRAVTLMQVETNGRRTTPVALGVAASSPGVFVTVRSQGRNQAAALNQDSSVNGPSNAAARGSVLQIFGTGQGRELPTAVRIGGRPARVLYSGQAPGLVEGAWQINAVVPDNVPPGDAELIVSSGGRVSAFGVVVAVR